MLFTSTILVATLISATQAQTPSGFSPQVNKQLNVIFNSTSVTKAGQLLSKSATQSAPNLALPNPSTNSTSTTDTYMFIMLDLDVPGSGSNTTRRTLLHAMTTGFKPTTQKINGTSTLLSSSQTGPAPYIAPGPPATDTIAHRYVQMLFLQPTNLNIPGTMFAETTSRLNFDVMAFMKKEGLAAPVAGNFFMVDGRSANTTGAGGNGNSTVVPFTGGAGRVSEGSSVMGLVGVLGALVLLV